MNSNSCSSINSQFIYDESIVTSEIPVKIEFNYFLVSNNVYRESGTKSLFSTFGSIPTCSCSNVVTKIEHKLYLTYEKITKVVVNYYTETKSGVCEKTFFSQVTIVSMFLSATVSL